MTKVNGVVLYRGPSQLDGSPIVVIATGLAKASRNAKTGGDLVQTWIIREDVSPTEAVNTGLDAAVCGGCKHRGRIEDGRNVGRTCYVTVFQAPLSVYKAYQRGIYPTVTPAEARELFAGRGVRVGAYGDPVAAPYALWAEWLADAAFHTGYTHQWALFPEFAEIVMASCDTPAERAMAKVLGFRTFRVTAEDARQDRAEREVVCPASAEAGHKTACDACKACGGNAAKAKADIVITVHGVAGKVRDFKALVAA